MAEAQPDPPQILEAEDSESGGDYESAYGSGAWVPGHFVSVFVCSETYFTLFDRPSDTTSLASEVKAYIYENGRR